MNIILIGIGGIASALFMFLGITWIKKSDVAHGLPENIGILYILITIIAGSITTYAICPSYSSLFLFVFFTAYLAIMAYTDFYVMKLYTIFHIMAAIIGYIALFNLSKLLIWEFVLSLGLIFFMRLVQMINVGDVKLLFASFPYICLLSDIYKITKFYFFFLFLIIVVFLSIVINFKAFFIEGKSKAPFAVPMLVGYIVVVFGMLFIKM